MGLSLIALGVGDAFSTRHWSTTFLVGCRGRWILVDCPHPIRRILREGTRTDPVDLDAVDAVVLTHLHADHASGLEGYGFWSRFALDRRARVITHPLVAQRLWTGHLAGGMHSLYEPGEPHGADTGLQDFFEVLHLSRRSPLRFGPFTLECRRTRHPVPTFALRIHGDGATLAYSADTAWDPDLVDWLSAGDLVVHETNHPPHTPYERLLSLPPELRERMRLVHYPDDFDVEAAEIEALVEGRRYQVTRSRP